MMYISRWVAISRGQMKAPHAWMNARMPSAPIAEEHNGTMICQKMRSSEAPSTRAASSSSSGILWAMCCRMRKMPKLMIKYGAAMP